MTATVVERRASAPPTTLLELDGVTVTFGGLKALDNVSLRVTDEHRFWGLVGPNGSGKSTAFNVVSGVHKPASGTVRTAGHGAAAVGRTFQHPRVFGGLTVVENLLAVARGISIGAARRRVDELLALVELVPLANRRAGELSLGQQKLVELARTLMLRPRVVLLDEVAAGIHPRLVDRIGHHLRVLAADGVTFLVIEHNMQFLMDLCSHVFVLSSGRLIAQGTPQAVQSNPDVIATYLGAQHD